jgi:hypothetical protein
MDEVCKKFLNRSGINFEYLNDLDGQVIPRELLINSFKYAEMKDEIINLKKNYSSTSLTGLHECADIKQRWPLLNIVRQLLNVYNMDMEPFRKSDGYDPTGKKKYRRFFIIKKRV